MARHIWIGHDARESIATKVCERSLLDVSADEDRLAIQHLVEPALRHAGLFMRESYRTPDGQRFDARDRKPYSTDFAFSRFLVPSLMQHRGAALFCDSDILWLRDPEFLFQEMDWTKAVMVVKHGALGESGTKMDGMIQQPYFRKNWSSIMLLNCGHPANQRLTPYRVNSMSGQWLHGFSWLDGEDQIGALDPRWNWLSGIDAQPKSGDPFAVHFTRGIPDMPGYEGSPYAEHWRKVKSRL